MSGFMLGIGLTMVILSVIAHYREKRLKSEIKSLDIRLVLLKDMNEQLLGQRSELSELLYENAEEAYFNYIEDRERCNE